MQRKQLVGIILTFYCVYRLLRIDEVKLEVIAYDSSYETSTTQAVLANSSKMIQL